MDDHDTTLGICIAFIITAVAWGIYGLAHGEIIPLPIIIGLIALIVAAITIHKG